MRYAKVVVGLPVEGPFDYLVPLGFAGKLKRGMRVKVNFAHRNVVGYVVGFSSSSSIKEPKPILSVLDPFAVLDGNMLALAKFISNYYCCSWGEAIETLLPQALRKARPLTELDISLPEATGFKDSTFSACNSDTEEKLIVLQQQDIFQRWSFYCQSLLRVLKDRKSVIVLVSDIHTAQSLRGFIQGQAGVSATIFSRQGQQQELKIWLGIKRQNFSLVLGTRSAIFAPVNNLGLVIIEAEASNEYKQEQTPRYHSREVAIFRCRQQKAGLILGDFLPSLEAVLMAKKKSGGFVCFG